MKKYRLALLSLIAGLSALAVSSCAYDPYFSGTSYSVGFGQGFGYGGSNFSTSYFVTTGDPRWAYDPYAACYYDFNRRAYYDPHIYGYYPIGYRPRYVVGAPHPFGWSRSSNFCPPPSRIRNYTIDNYTDRAQCYRSLGRDWSRNVSVSAPTYQSRPGYAGRENQDRGFYQSRGSGFPQSQNSFSSRGGDDLGRNLSSNRNPSSGGFSRGNTGQINSQPTSPMNGRDYRRNGSAGSYPQIQPRQQIERSPAPSSQSMQRSAPPTQRQFSPNSGGGGGTYRSESRGSSGESPRRGGGGIRSLGEG